MFRVQTAHRLGDGQLRTHKSIVDSGDLFDIIRDASRSHDCWRDSAARAPGQGADHQQQNGEDQGAQLPKRMGKGARRLDLSTPVINSHSGWPYAT